MPRLDSLLSSPTWRPPGARLRTPSGAGQWLGSSQVGFVTRQSRSGPFRPPWRRLLAYRFFGVLLLVLVLMAISTVIGLALPG